MPRRSSTQRFEPRAPSVAVLAVAPLVMLGVVMVALIVPSRVGWRWPPWIGAVAIGAVVAAILLFVWRITRFARRIAESDGFLCLNCHYDLHGLPDVGECPECGEAYERSRLERLWNSWLQDQTKNQKSIRPRSESAEAREPELPRARGPTLIVLTVLPVVLLAPLTLLAFALTKATTMPWWAATPMWVGLPAIAIWNARRVSRFQRRLKDADGLLCLRCHRRLELTSDSTVVCTHCGRHDPPAGVRRRWDEYLKR